MNIGDKIRRGKLTREIVDIDIDTMEETYALDVPNVPLIPWKHYKHTRYWTVPGVYICSCEINGWIKYE